LPPLQALPPDWPHRSEATEHPIWRLFSVVDSSCYGNGQTDGTTTWCEGWLRLYDKALLFVVVLTWLSGLVILIVVWTAIRRRRRMSQPESQASIQP
jgi:hypothetical protein